MNDSRRRMWRLRMRRPASATALLCSVAALLCGSVLRAHEIGTTRVSVALREDRSYAIDVVTDAATLVERLEAAQGGQVGRDTSAAGLESRLRRLDDTFRRKVHVVFDSGEVRPATSYSVALGADLTSAAVATIHLTGGIPAEARQVAWSYAWTAASYALTIGTGGSPAAMTEWLEGDRASTPFPLGPRATPAGRPGTIWRYLILGFTHIVPAGFDHVLFVLGLYLLSGRARAVLAQVSAFTVAHSITLGLSVYGVIAVPPGIVEPVIALSIAYVAIENLVHAELKSWRIVLVFAFGLLHGMGFAGALRELGLPRSEFVTALLTFNIGVEAGQLTVIGTAFVLLGVGCAGRPWYRRRVVIPLSVLIACTAVYWTVERLSF